MIKNITQNIHIVIIFVVWFAFASQYFFTDAVPYPSRFQTTFFPPWSAYEEFAGPVKNNAMPDIITQIYPWRIFSIEQLKNGSMPLWNPYSFAGTPHLANYQSATLFPLNILFFIFSAPFAWQMLVLLQPLLAGLFTFMFAKSIKTSNTAATISSLGFMFSGFITTWMGYATLGYAILFLPLALFAIQKYSKTVESKYLVLASACIPLSFFSGHLQISIYFLMMIICFTFFKFIFDNKKQKYLTLAVSFIAGLFIAMPQLLPSYEFYTHSLRSSLYISLEVIPWSYIPTMLAPDFFGNPVTRNDWFGHYAEWSSFIGVVSLLLFIYAILSKKTKMTYFFLASAAAAIVLAFNTPLSKGLSDARIPLLGTSAASRIIVLFSFSASVLSGIGYDNLQRTIKEKKMKTIIVWVATIMIIFTSLWSIVVFDGIKHFDHAQIAKKNLILPTLITAAAIGTVFFRIYIKMKARTILFSLVIIGLISFDLLRFVTKWMPKDPADQIFPETAITSFYKEIKDTDRALHNYTAENSVYYMVPSLGGYDPLYIARYAEFVKYVATGHKESGERSVVTFPQNGEFTPEALSLTSTNYIIHKTSDTGAPWGFPFSKYPTDQFEKVFDDSRLEVYENKKANPRAVLVSNYTTEIDENSILTRLFSEDFDSKKEVVLENNPSTPKTKTEGTAEIVKYTPNEVHITTSSTNSAILVLSDSYYPGWNAYINGEKSEVQRANYTFRSVVVPEGEHEVVIKYEPKSFSNGIILSGIGFAMLGTTTYISRKKKKK